MSYCHAFTGLWTRGGDYLLNHLRAPKVVQKVRDAERDTEGDAEPEEDAMPDVSKQMQVVGIRVLYWWRRRRAAIAIQRAVTIHLVNKWTRLQKVVQDRRTLQCTG